MSAFEKSAKAGYWCSYPKRWMENTLKNKVKQAVHQLGLLSSSSQTQQVASLHISIHIPSKAGYYYK